MMTFAKWFAEQRTSRQLQGKVLAAELKVDTSWVSQIERGVRFPTDQQIKKVSEFFKVDSVEVKKLVAIDKIDKIIIDYELQGVIEAKLC